MWMKKQMNMTSPLLIYFVKENHGNKPVDNSISQS